MLRHNKMSLFVFQVALLCAANVCYVYGQTGKQNLISTVDSLNRQAARYYYQSDSMILYARPAYALAKKAGYERGEALALRFCGNYHHAKSDFDSALVLYRESLDIFRTLNDTFETASTLLSIAMVYNNTNDHVKSIEYGMNALPLFEQLEDSKGIGKVLNMLGISWATQGEYGQAKKYFLQYNSLAAKGTDTVDIGYSFNNLGGIYRDLKNPDSALYFFRLGSEYFSRKNYLSGMALAFRNIGGIAYDRENYDTALYYAQKGLAINLQSGEKRAKSHSYHDIASVLLKMKDTQQAVVYFNKALLLAQEIIEKAILRNSSYELAVINENRGNYKEALSRYKTFKAWNDTLFNIEKTRMYGDLERKYQTAQKEQQINILNQESAIQQLRLKQRNLLLAGSVILLSSAALMIYFTQNRRKLKAEARLQGELFRQQQQAAREVLHAEERERRRIATDLHDGVGQLLSAALLNLHQAGEHTEENSTARQMAERAAALLSQGCDEMRSISHKMMPSALLKAGLAMSVKEFLEKIDGDKIKVYLDVAGLDGRLDEQTETILYRVIQEAVNNVIKHAAASELSIQIAKDEQGIAVAIEDNGKGFDVSRLPETEGIGLKNIRSRIALLNGTLDVDATPGKGTLLAIYVPAEGNQMGKG